MNPSDDLSKPLRGRPVLEVRAALPQTATASAETKRHPMSILANYFGNTYVAGNRTVFYHPDGSYQEFGVNDMQTMIFISMPMGIPVCITKLPPNRKASSFAIRHHPTSC